MNKLDHTCACYVHFVLHYMEKYLTLIRRYTNVEIVQALGIYYTPMESYSGELLFDMAM